MAITMKNVKAINIPVSGVSKSVSTIKDSNNNIIWGSYDEFPYRRLEYVICDGTAACNSGIVASTTTGNSVTLFKLKIKTGSDVTTQQRVIANFTSGATYTRMYAFLVNTKLQNTIGSSWGDGPDATANTEYTIESSMLYNDRYLKVNGVKTSFADVNTYTATSGNTYGIGAGINKSSTPIFEAGFKGYIYDIEMIYSNDTKHYYFIPVQRKSDNKVGFLKYSTEQGAFTNDCTFLPSTWLSEFGAGPVVDEYYSVGSWHTLWQGSCDALSYKTTHTIDDQQSSSSVAKDLCTTLAHSGYSPKLKITFSSLETQCPNSWSTTYIVDNTSPTIPPSSPLKLDPLLSGGNSDILKASVSDSDGSNTNWVALETTKVSASGDHNLWITMRCSGKGTSTVERKAQLIVTKIEQYY